MVTTGASMGLVFNQNWLQQRFAETWDENPSKMYDTGVQQQIQGGPEGSPGQEPTQKVPQVNLKPERQPSAVPSATGR